MKKILILVAILMALMLVVVACEEPPQPEQPTDSTAESTPETPTTEPPTTEETTTDPGTTDTDPGTTDTEPGTTDTDPGTTDTDPDDPIPPEIDPADPTWFIDAAGLAEKAATGNTMAAELMDGYVRLTATGSDPYFQFLNAAGQQPQYLVISYRTNTTRDGQVFIGSGTGPNGQGDNPMLTWNEDGNWNLAILDISTVASIQDGNVNYARLDFFTDQGDEGDYFDIDFIAFFNTPEYAQAYAFELHKAPMWDADKSVLAHVNWDQLYLGTGDATNDTATNVFFAPGASGSWDKIADMTAYSADALTYWGWVAYKGELGTFGYQIDYNAPVYNPEWAFVGADHDAVVGAAQAGGGDSGHRMKVAIDIAGLEGEHTVRVLYKNAEGAVVCLLEFKLIMPVVSHQNGYTTNVGSNFADAQDDVDLKVSDLAQLFDQINYGAGVAMFAKYNDGNPYYGVTSFTSMHTQPNGYYAFNVNVVESSGNEGQASIFVRGIQPASIEGHYFGQDGHDGGAVVSMGGAGIYLNPLATGKLRINIKTYVDGAYVPNVYYVTIDSNDITVVDNGSVVTILAGGKKVATIEIIGTKDYGIVGKNGEVAADALAEKAILTLADGTVVELDNACVAAKIAGSDVGVATRTGTLNFSSASLQAYNTVEIPEEFFTPEEKVNVALNKPVSSDNIENDDNVPWKATDGNDGSRWGARPNGEANLIVDLQGLYKLSELNVLFESALWNYTISISTDGEAYTVIYEGEPHGAKAVNLKGEVEARYIKFTRLDDTGVAGDHWFSIYEVYAYGELIGENFSTIPGETFKPETFAEPTADELAAGYTYDIGAGQFFQTVAGACTYADLATVGADFAAMLQAAGFGQYAYFAQDHISVAPAATDVPVTYTFRIYDMLGNIATNERAFLLLNMTGGGQNSPEVVATVEADAENEGVYYVTFTETAPGGTDEFKFYMLEKCMFYVDTLTVKVG